MRLEEVSGRTGYYCFYSMRRSMWNRAFEKAFRFREDARRDKCNGGHPKEAEEGAEVKARLKCLKEIEGDMFAKERSVLDTPIINDRNVSCATPRIIPFEGYLINYCENILKVRGF